MSQIIPLEAIPSQSLSITLDNIRYSLRFRDLSDLMSADISVDDTIVLTGHRVVSSQPLIPYKYLEGEGGNFIFITELGDIPYWNQFGITQYLLYFSAEEMRAIRGD